MNALSKPKLNFKAIHMTFESALKVLISDNFVFYLVQTLQILTGELLSFVFCFVLLLFC